jgi:putative Mn2+ efflux pump MntP
MVALLIVAVALGLNNFGAAIAIGVSGVDRRTEIKVATVFGLCDVAMPATGMLIGTGLAGPLGSAARWAGAGILFVTAVWGLTEELRGGDDAPRAWHGWRLLVSGAALSLDDLAVGLALGTVRYPIVLAVILFGLMSFVMSVIGLKLGGKLGGAVGERGEVVGAIVLIGISGAMAMGWLLPAHLHLADAVTRTLISALPIPLRSAAIRRRSSARSAATRPPQTPCWPMSQCRSDSARHSARTRQELQMAIAAAASWRALPASALTGNHSSGSRPASAHRPWLIIGSTQRSRGSLSCLW